MNIDIKDPSATFKNCNLNIQMGQTSVISIVFKRCFTIRFLKSKSCIKLVGKSSRIGMIWRQFEDCNQFLKNFRFWFPEMIPHHWYQADWLIWPIFLALCLSVWIGIFFKYVTAYTWVEQEQQCSKPVATISEKKLRHFSEIGKTQTRWAQLVL